MYDFDFLPSTFLSDYIEHNSNKVLLKYWAKLSKGHSKSQQKDKTNHNIENVIWWTDPTVFRLLFFFASEIQQIRNKKKPTNTLKRLPCVKTIPNVRMVQCRLKDNTPKCFGSFDLPLHSVTKFHQNLQMYQISMAAGKWTHSWCLRLWSW